MCTKNLVATETVLYNIPGRRRQLLIHMQQVEDVDDGAGPRPIDVE